MVAGTGVAVIRINRPSETAPDCIADRHGPDNPATCIDGHTSDQNLSVGGMALLIGIKVAQGSVALRCCGGGHYNDVVGTPGSRVRNRARKKGAQQVVRQGIFLNFVVPANNHRGCAGLGPSPVQAFECGGGLDSSPAQPLWLFAGMTKLSGSRKCAKMKLQHRGGLQRQKPPVAAPVLEFRTGAAAWEA